MNRYARGAMVASLALVVPVTLAAPAHAEDVTVRGGSANGPGGTGGGDVVENRNLAAGSYEFLRDGILQSAPGPDDRSGVYWEARTQEFPDSVALDWAGSQAVDGQSADPAVVIYIDVDGAAGATPRDALLHEDIYGEGDLWLPESGSDLAKAASPGDSSGSSFAGPIGEWKTNLEELYPDLEIVQVGSNLSGDGQGRSEGLLRSVTLGDDVYTFTSDAAPEPEPQPEDVRGGATTERVGNRLSITFTSRSPVTANAPVGQKLQWRVAVNRRVEAKYVQGFDEEDTFDRRFPNRTGSYEVRIVKNGEIVRTITVDTGTPR